MFLTSIFERTGCKAEPNTRIVSKEYNNVSTRIIGPISSYYEAYKAKAYAIAPLKPENHITN